MCPSNPVTPGIGIIAGALCENMPQHVPTMVEELEPILKKVYDAQRTVVAAMFVRIRGRKEGRAAGCCWLQRAWLPCRASF